MLTGRCIYPYSRLPRSHPDSDCVLHNFLMDGDAMYPEGFHPVKYTFKRDYSGWAPYIPRSVAGVRYYFADFGISIHRSGEERRKFVTGAMGRDQEPPELSDTIPYDPFKLDVFIIGNMLRKEFCDVIIPPICLFPVKLTILQKFSNTDFLRPLALRMTHGDPEQRPNAEEALREWLQIRETIYTVNKEWRPRPRTEHVLETAVLDAMSLCSISVDFARAVLEGVCGR